MRVLHIEAGKNLYGGAKQVTYLINGIQSSDDILAQDCEQFLACTAGSDIAKSDLGTCTILPIPYSSELDFRVVSRLKKIIQQHNIQLVHVHSRRGADVWGGIAAKLSNIPAICTRRVDNAEGKLARYKYAMYNAVASISQGVFDVVSTHCDPQKPQPIIHSAVNFDDYYFTADRSWLNKNFDIPKNHSVIANFAQLIERKGQADIIRAMHTILESHPNTTCLLFGKGKMHESYQSKIEELGLSDNIKLCGFTDQVARILPCVDVVVHPALAEGLGVILLQAAAAKRAIVAAKAGGIPEIVLAEKTGLLIEPGEYQQLAAHVVRLLSNPAQRNLLGENAYQHVMSDFSIPSMAQQYLTLYHSLL